MSVRVGKGIMEWQLKEVKGAHILTHPYPHRILSSASVGGGLKRCQTILFRYVSPEYNHPSPESDLKNFAKTIGIRIPFLGFLTAVSKEKFSFVVEKEGSLIVFVWGTVGLGNATSAGITPPVQSTGWGTINLFIAVNQPLLPQAMVGSVITATEAKVGTLVRLGISTRDGSIATGTSTDAIGIASPLGRGGLPYAGPVTLVGSLIARGVIKVLEKSIPFR
jgi:iron complex transport system ATP-binding protein